MKTNIISTFPHEVIVNIFEFDGTYRELYSLCMKELTIMYLLHKQILYTYDYISENNKYVFRSFSTTFFNK